MRVVDKWPFQAATVNAVRSLLSERSRTHGREYSPLFGSGTISSNVTRVLAPIPISRRSLTVSSKPKYDANQRPRLSIWTREPECELRFGPIGALCNASVQRNYARSVFKKSHNHFLFWLLEVGSACMVTPIMRSVVEKRMFVNEVV